MDTARIAELLDPFLAPQNGQRLTTNDLHRISTYINTLQRWNARVNLTAIRTEEEIVTRHFGESFFAARHLFPLCASVPPVVNAKVSSDIDPQSGHSGRPLPQAPRSAALAQGASAPAVADVGSGAGFPGIPLKLWAPQIHLTLIESNHKKATFLREVTRALTLTDINIQTARAETLAEKTTEKFDAVTLRAVERFEAILPVAATLVAPSGRLALLIGAAQASQARTALPTLTWSNPKPVPQSESRVLLIGTHPL